MHSRDEDQEQLRQDGWLSRLSETSFELIKYHLAQGPRELAAGFVSEPPVRNL